MQLVVRKDSGDGLQLIKPVVLVAATEGALGEEIHREQNAQQKRQKTQREFPE